VCSSDLNLIKSNTHHDDIDAYANIVYGYMVVVNKVSNANCINKIMILRI